MVRDLPPSVAQAILVQLCVLQSLLLSRAIAGTRNGNEIPAEDRLLTIPQTAARLNIPAAYAYELARRGEIPTVRVGKKYVRVPLAALEKWLAEKRA